MKNHGNGDAFARQVVELAAAGLNQTQIAEALGIGRFVLRYRLMRAGYQLMEETRVCVRRASDGELMAP